MDQQYEPATIAGVIALTALIVSQLKMVIGSTPYLKRVPVIFVAIATAMGLCVLARYAGYLDGPLGKLMAHAAIAALGSSGLYNIYSGSSTQTMSEASYNPSVPGDQAPSGFKEKSLKLILAGIMLATLPGCGLVTSYQNSTPLGKVALAKTDFTKLLNVLADLRDQGFITQAQLDKVKPEVLSAQLALQEWEAVANRGQDTKDVEARFEAAADVIRRLRDALKPATRPSSYRSVPNGSRNFTDVSRRGGFTCRYASA